MGKGNVAPPILHATIIIFATEQRTDLLRGACARVAGAVTVVSAVILLVALGLCGVEG